MTERTRARATRSGRPVPGAAIETTDQAGAKPRRRRVTKAVVAAFLSQLAMTAHVELSAAAVGVHRETFYKRRRDDPAFAHQWRMALLAGYDRLEGALIRRALGEEHMPAAVVADGEPVGELDVPLALQLLARYRGAVEGATREAIRSTRDAAAATLLTKLRAYARSAGIAPPSGTAVAALPAPAEAAEPAAGA